MSKYVDDLIAAAKVLRSENYPISAEACENGAIRMQRMEDFIVEMNNKNPINDQEWP